MGLLLSSPEPGIWTISGTWMNSTSPRGRSAATWRMASRKGWDSMSPTVPPISVMTTSTSSGGHGVDPALDLVGDVGDDLDRSAQIVAPALPVQNGPVDLAGGDGGVAGQVLVHEPLIVAQIQIRLGAVVGDKDLAVLIGAHGAGVHIDIGVELLVAHPQAPLLRAAGPGMRRRCPCPGRRPRRR